MELMVASEVRALTTLSLVGLCACEIACAPSSSLSARAEAWRSGQCAVLPAEEIGPCTAAWIEKSPADARARCDALAEPRWRDECFFVAADALKVSGEDALAACARAGRYGDACISNAISREVTALDRERADWDAEVMRIAREYGRPAKGEDVVRRRRGSTPSETATSPGPKSSSARADRAP
jgi:hypothetical protein